MTERKRVADDHAGAPKLEPQQDDQFKIGSSNEPPIRCRGITSKNKTTQTTEVRDTINNKVFKPTK